MVSKTPTEEQSHSPRGSAASQLHNMKASPEATDFDKNRYIKGRDRRRKRVSKACERCRVKKIKVCSLQQLKIIKIRVLTEATLVV